MSEFVNTIDILGDHAVTDGLIARTIEEFADDRVTLVYAHAFRGCDALTLVNFPNAASIGVNAFEKCLSLRTVVLPSVASVGAYAFYTCPSLTDVQVLGPAVIGSYAFASCNALTEVVLPAATKLDAYAFLTCTQLSRFSGPAVKTIGEKAFQSCPALVTLDVPTATNIAKAAFENCSLLAEVNGPALTLIDCYAFKNCVALTELSFPELLTIVYHAFYNCTGLTSVYIPKVTNLGDNAFLGCKKLTDIHMPAVTTLGHEAFEGCSSLKSVYLPVVTSIQHDTFKGCSSITEAYIPEATSIGIRGFSGCSALRTVVAPKVTYASESAFAGNTSLGELCLPAVTGLGTWAFSGCTALKRLDLPVATSLGKVSLGSCSSLEALILRNTEAVCTLVATSAFEKSSIASGTGRVYVPSALVESYKAATNWATYADCIVALEDNTVDGTVTGALGGYSVTNALTKVTNSNPALRAGASYSAVLTSTNGLEISAITVTMGGVDVTDEAYSEGVINIESVTGDIVITASAVAYAEVYNWDFTQSLADTVNGQTAVLAHTNGGTAPTRNENGLVFDAAMQYCDLGQISLAGRSIEIDVAEFDFKGSSSAHIRFLMNSTGGHGALIWRKTNGWAVYNGSWSGVYGDAVNGITTDIINCFNGKTIKLEYDENCYPSLYIDGVYVGTSTVSMSAYDTRIYIGASPGTSGDTQSAGNQCYNMTITGIRIYEEVTA